MARLILVSNRVSVPSNTRPGGLEVALRESLEHSGGIWFGWSGEITEQTAPKITKRKNVTYVTVDLNSAAYDMYYLGFANSTLWPLLHYCLEFIDYRKHNFEEYIKVNQRLAALLRPMLLPDDVIWVHDYHLFPFAEELQKLGVTNRCGFFLHTPFPPPEVLAVLPHYERILESLCAYDLIGFQTDDNVRAFLNCINEMSNGTVNGIEFTAFGRTSRAIAFPIGIDTKHFSQLAERSMNSPEARRLRTSMASRKLIIGVDRLDYSKGLPNRFKAIDMLLSEYPEHRNRFTYLQIAPHSRSDVAQYRTLRRDLETAAGRINGKYAEFDWTPIRYLNRSFTRQTLAGFFRFSHIGLVTPLRDGMNLVAKEYIAAQNSNDPGVLVLSRFAGAARQLDNALLVNPVNIDEIAEALHRGLTMPLEERQALWAPMLDGLTTNNITKWHNDFINALTA